NKRKKNPTQWRTRIFKYGMRILFILFTVFILSVSILWVFAKFAGEHVNHLRVPKDSMLISETFSIEDWHVNTRLYIVARSPESLLEWFISNGITERQDWQNVESDESRYTTESSFHNDATWVKLHLISLAIITDWYPEFQPGCQSITIYRSGEAALEAYPHI